MNPNDPDFRRAHIDALNLAEELEVESRLIAQHIQRGQYGEIREHTEAIGRKRKELGERTKALRRMADAAG